MYNNKQEASGRDHVIIANIKNSYWDEKKKIIDLTISVVCHIFEEIFLFYQGFNDFLGFFRDYFSDF